MPDYRLPDGRIPVLLSADDPDGLRDEALAVGAYLAAHPDVPTDEIADMLWRTRSPRRQRALILADDRPALDSAVAAIGRGDAHRDVVTARAAGPRRIAMVVAGQGSQRPGLGAELYDASAAYRGEVDTCLSLLEADRAASVRRYLLDGVGGDVQVGGSGSGEADGTVVQPALVLHALGMLALWHDHGVVPDVVVGHSLGEIAAAVAAGLLDRGAAMRIALARAHTTASVTIDDHAMAALGISAEDCAALIARRPGWAEVTVVNGPESVCVNGDRATVADLIAATAARGRFARPIAITHPAHTTAMRPLAEPLRARLAAAGVPEHFGTPRVPCIGATLGTAIPADISVADYWYLNVRNTVRFDRAIEAAAAAGADVFVEIADHPVLAAGIVDTLTRRSSADGPDHAAAPIVVTTSRRSARGLAEFSRAMVAVTLHRPDLDRHRWAVPGGPVRLPLRGFPSTVMRRRRLWLPPADVDLVERPTALAPTPALASTPTPAQASTPAPEHASTLTPDHAPTGRGVVRLVSVWKPLERKSVGPPRSIRIVDSAGAYGDWVAALEQSARRFGATIHLGPDRPEIAADTLLWAIPGGGDPAEAVKQVTAYLTDPDGGAALDGGPPAGLERVVIATLGAEQLADDELPSVFSAGAAVAVECLVAEWPGVRCARLDLPVIPANPTDAAAAMAALHTVGERDFAIRAGVVHVRRLRADPPTAPLPTAPLPTASPPTELPSTALPSSAGGAGRVLIVGGTGRLGLAYARRLIDRGAHTVTLLNRSGPRPDLDAAVDELRARGAGVEVVGCDITDPAGVAAFAGAHPEPIDLLVHAAVDYVHADSAALDAATIDRSLAAKVDGLLHLFDASVIGPGTRVELCSSISATFTGPGLAAYAAGNRMLDAIAVHLRGSGVACRSVQWGVFGDPDAGSDAYRALVAGAAGAGLLDLRPDEAFDAAGVGDFGVGAFGVGDFDAGDFATDALVIRADRDLLARVCELQGRPNLLPTELPEPPSPAKPSAFAADATSAADPTPRSADPTPRSADPTPRSAGRDPAGAVATILRNVLGLTDDEPIDQSLPLVGLGVDSLQALDLNRAILDTLGRDLPVTTLLSGASVDDLIDLLRSPPAG